MKEIVLATKNEGKLKEFRSLAAGRSWQVHSLAEWPDLSMPEETGTTFRENARIKAEWAAEFSGMIALADDSGLEVDYLDGLPGVYSARFSGEHGNDANNNEKLLSLLDGVSEKKRKARFCCAVAVAVPGGETVFCAGICEGVIAQGPSGDHGFGYDPLFWLPQFQRTLAQLSMQEKNEISHRGKAFRAVLPILEKILG